jgi:hypothetical protein
VTDAVHIRTITAADAEAVVRMWSDFARYLRELGDTDDQNFGIEAFLRDGFGPDPAFSGIIAERDGGAVGYLLYHFGYDSDQAMRILYIVDLWVDPAARCQARGGRELSWAVFPPNKLSVAFYERLGARFYNTTKFMHIAAADL